MNYLSSSYSISPPYISQDIHVVGAERDSPSGFLGGVIYDVHKGFRVIVPPASGNGADSGSTVTPFLAFLPRRLDGKNNSFPFLLLLRVESSSACCRELPAGVTRSRSGAAGDPSSLLRSWKLTRSGGGDRRTLCERYSKVGGGSDPSTKSSSEYPGNPGNLSTPLFRAASVVGVALSWGCGGLDPQDQNQVT